MGPRRRNTILATASALAETCHGLGLSISQVGSSLLWPNEANDVDFLVVDSELTGVRNRLKRAIDQVLIGSPISPGFDPSSATLRSEVASVCSLVSEDIAFQVQPRFVFGPVAGARRRGPILLHFCGELSVEEIEFLFDALPFHGLAFHALNKCLAGHSVPSLTKKPMPSLNAYCSWVSVMAARATESAIEHVQRKLAKRILLCKELFLFSRGLGGKCPYSAAHRAFENLMMRPESSESDGVIEGAVRTAMDLDHVTLNAEAVEKRRS